MNPRLFAILLVLLLVLGCVQVSTAPGEQAPDAPAPEPVPQPSPAPSPQPRPAPPTVQPSQPSSPDAPLDLLNATPTEKPDDEPPLLPAPFEG